MSVPSEGELLRPSADEEEDGQLTPRAEAASLSEQSDKDIHIIEKQTTGGLWGWWTGTANKPEEGSPAHYVQGLKDV